jgi:tRNA threonylcarbamoyladenosine biosynthesis protein TsaE
MIQIDLPDLNATQALADRLAPHLACGDLVALEGDLGAGKTEFARALIRARTGDATLDVPSPTFTLVQLYDDAAGCALWHFDLYRLQQPDEVLELGWDEALDGLVLVEWPDRLGDLAPIDRLTVRLVAGPRPDARHVTLTGHGRWAARLADLPSLADAASLRSA